MHTQTLDESRSNTGLGCCFCSPSILCLSTSFVPDSFCANYSSIFFPLVLVHVFIGIGYRLGFLLKTGQTMFQGFTKKKKMYLAGQIQKLECNCLGSWNGVTSWLECLNCSGSCLSEAVVHTLLST